ncbi:hypothetical protein FraEuI1c_3092 [Pseudofrankia inefficax]|uniref:Uncharacterized protein n=1 Tax=Pseudofrankia inefficax (strain DSM 45817 / CECT 9037 / DDB 130130 / EuI1c) TaxID=298654 RepID=E3JCX6_PSEI1|nr:hypothetical protein FraEuI1c_3092 [Pseudofrankia inefficax]
MVNPYLFPLSGGCDGGYSTGPAGIGDLAAPLPLARVRSAEVAPDATRRL